jgi:hypothetical protein
VKTGVHNSYNYLKILDSGFRRNDEKGRFSTFYEFVKINVLFAKPSNPYNALILTP